MEQVVLRIDGTRHALGKIKAGTYRQVLLLGEDYKNYSDQDLVDDMQEIIRVAFDLTKEQASRIDTDRIIPTFRKIQKLAMEVFIEKAAEVPNAEGSEE